jgi:hypothetical protein
LSKRKYKSILKIYENFRTAKVIKSAREIGQPAEKLVKIQGPSLSLSSGFDATIATNI